MSHPFLTDLEIREIAAPLTQPAAIVRWFRRSGFHGLKVRPNGMPLITRAHFDVVTAGIQARAQNIGSAKEQPDVSRYLERLSKRTNVRSSNRGD